MFTTARHLFSIPISQRLISVLSDHLRLGLPNSVFPSCFPTKTQSSPPYFQRICPGPRLSTPFRNIFSLYGEELFVILSSNPQSRGLPFSAFRECLFNIFAAVLHPQAEDAQCRGEKYPFIMVAQYIFITTENV